MSQGMRGELEEALDFFETLTVDVDGDTFGAMGEFRETYSDEVERSRICQRLYDLSHQLEPFTLATWPQEAKATA